MGKIKKPRPQVICFCNNVSEEMIKNAIRNGAMTLGQIYDATTAGIGPCGGSCRRKIAPMLEKFLTTGSFEDEN